MLALAQDLEEARSQRDKLKDAVRALMDFGNRESMDGRASWAMSKARAALAEMEEQTQ